MHQLKQMLCQWQPSCW